jgi:hypothetical protein
VARDAENKAETNSTNRPGLRGGIESSERFHFDVRLDCYDLAFGKDGPKT